MRPKIDWFLVVGAAALLAVFWAVGTRHETSETQPAKPSAVVPHQATHEECIHWAQTRIGPMIEAGMTDQTPEVRQIMLKLKGMIDSHEIMFGAEPGNENGGVDMASTHLDEMTGKPVIAFSMNTFDTLFGKLTPDQAYDVVIETACHEVLHLIYTPPRDILTKKTLEDKYRWHVDSEVLVWALTITKATRPMIRDGRAIAGVSKEASDYFASCGNAVKSEKWRQYVANNFTPPFQVWKQMQK